MTTENSFELPSLPFDFHIWLKNERIETLLEEITLPLLAERTGHKIRANYQVKLMLCYKIILLNLLCMHKHMAAECLAIPRNNTDIQPHKRYGLNGLVSVDAFNEAYDTLCKEYINLLQKGEEFLGFRTRISSTLKLSKIFDKHFPEAIVFFERHPNEEVIILKKNKYEQQDTLLNYSDTKDTNLQRENLHKINQVLQSNWYDLELTDNEFEALRIRMKRRHQKDSKKHFFINYTSRRLKRIYNNGSFERGGRFYGGWWQSVPKEYRQHIRINGKLTIETDYSNMHPLILYAYKGLQFDLDSDAYKIDGITRGTAKLAFNLLLNKASLRKPRGYNPDEWEGLDWKTLKDLIFNRHPEIREYFGSGIGLDLQYIDSQIAEKVMLYFTKKNYPCLPLHDSFIVHYALKDELAEEMGKAYSSILGEFNIGKDCKDYFQYFTDTHALKLLDTGNETSMDIEDALGITGEYKEYRSREQLWNSNY